MTREYRVIQRFTDGENGKPFAKDKGGVTYEVGQNYPIEGFKPTDKHIEYLLNCNFQSKGAVIAKVESEKKPDKSVREVKDDGTDRQAESKA
jgi:hypothetical protein